MVIFKIYKIPEVYANNINLSLSCKVRQQNQFCMKDFIMPFLDITFLEMQLVFLFKGKCQNFLNSVFSFL